jgi:hypothetical protein
MSSKEDREIPDGYIVWASQNRKIVEFNDPNMAKELCAAGLDYDVLSDTQ